MIKSQQGKLQSDYQKLCNKDPDYRNRVSFKEYRALNDIERSNRIEESKKLEDRWNRSRVAPTIWEKIDKDPVYSKHMRDRVCIEDKDGNIEYGEMTMSNRLSFKEPRGPK